MILMNQNGEIIKIECWEDMLDRPAFNLDLRSKDIKLKAVVGRYHLPESFYCGLKDCHSIHKKGYFILTENKEEINVGHMCGSTHFGLEYEAMVRVLERDIENATNRESLHEIQSRVENYISEVNHIYRKNDMNSLHKKLKQLTTKRSRFPLKLPETICRMVKNRDTIIRIETEASNEEVELLEEMQGKEIHRPHYITKEVGSIVGLEALYPSNDFKHILQKDLLPNLRELETFEIDSASDLEVRNKLLWARGIDNKIKKAKTAIRKAHQLLTEDNLMQLFPVINGRKGSDVFRDFCKYSLRQA